MSETRELMIYCDAAVQPRNPGGHGSCAYVVYEDGKRIAEQYGYIGTGPEMTNNVAEWRAVIGALKWAVKNAGGCRVRIMSDSMLVVNQLSGRWGCNKASLAALRDEARQLARQ